MIETIEIIRIAVGLNMLIFGLDQITRPGYWTKYIPDWLDSMLPTSKETDIRIHSFGNLILGILLVLNVFEIYIVIASLIWWISIFPFALIENWRIALRDSVIITSLFVYLLIAS